MDDTNDVKPEVTSFLRGRANELEREAPSVETAEATSRVVPRSLEPRRWTKSPVAFVGGARRAPKIAAAVLAALLIGSVAGFAAGRNSNGTPSPDVAARGAAPDTSTPVPVQASGLQMNAYGEMGAPTVTRLFIRTTSENVVLRGYLQEWSTDTLGAPVCDTNSWCPPPECNMPNSFMAEVSNEEAVMQNGVQTFPLEKNAETRGFFMLGEMEGAPATVWIVATNADVTNVRATWLDGFVDEMVPVNGWAIVAHDGDGNPKSIEAIMNDGSVTQTTTDRNNAYVYPEKCNPPPPPPPELPPAGEEQPDDVDGARAGVRKAYETVFNNDAPIEARGDYIEDAENLKAAGDQVKSNFPEAADTVTVTVGEIRFLSKTEAALLFELNYSGGALFGQQVGYAKLIDGGWKISRDTMCMVYGWGGGVCDPPPDPARSGGSPGDATTTASASASKEGVASDN